MRPLPSFLVVLGLLATVLLPAPARADQRTLAIAIARQVIVPGYQKLRVTTEAQATAWRGFCAAPKADGVDGLRQAYQTAADAWSSIEFLHYGPIGDGLRYERVAMWPERKNAVGKALAGLMAKPDDPTPEAFAKSSVAGQGLTALERLLYDGDDVTPGLTDGSKDALRRCRIGVAIADGLAAIALDVSVGWSGEGGLLARLERGDPDLAKEALTRIVTDHLAMLELVADKKIYAVMGKAPDLARPQTAEAWRSGRTVRAIVLNLETGAAISRIMTEGDPNEQRSILGAIETAIDIAQTLPGGIGELAQDPKRRSEVVLLHDSVRGIRDVSEMALPAIAGITVGFNSSDGD